jgi:hypothetical protein
MEPRAAPRTSSLALSLALFLFLVSVYLLTYSPRFHSSDGLAVFATAESLARRGEWDADQIRWMGRGQGLPGVDGRLYTRKGVGQSLLALPLVWLGLHVRAWGPATTAQLFNALVTAAAAALALRYLAALGYPPRVALAAGLAFGLATPAWPYAKTFFSDPLAALCLLGAALALLRFGRTGRAAYGFAAGLALAVAVAARYANAAMIPLFALALLAHQIGHARAAGRRPAIAARASGITAGLAPASGLPLPALRPWLAFGAPLALAALALAYHNLARYGDPFNTGYLPEENFAGVWLQGIAGMLVSPGRGLFLYAPLLLLALPGAVAFIRRHRAEGLLAAGLILAHLLLYGKWFMWHGGYAWGPRFLVAVLPFFALFLAPAVEWARASRGWRLAFGGLALLSGLVQVLGLSVHFELFQNRLLDTGLPLFAPVTFFDPRYSPLLGQFQFLRPEHLDFAWMAAARPDWPLLAALLATVLVCGWALARIANLLSYQSANLPSLQSSLLPSLLLLAAAAWLLARAHAGQPDALAQTVAQINARSSAADAVVTGAPEEAAAFADLYKGRADVLGLAAGPPLDAETAAALRETAARHPRVWWLPNWLPPGDSALERWLMDAGYRAEDRTVAGRRLALYYFPPGPLPESAVGATFGGAIRLESAALPPAARPGDVLPVRLGWQALAPVAADYHVFVHLLDAAGKRAAQSDGQPALWTRPTSSWQPGALVEDRHALSLPADTPPGEYRLVAGLYLPDTGGRLATGDGADVVLLGTVMLSE